MLIYLRSPLNDAKETIGIEYELIIIDNSQNNHSIFSAYNEGVKRAKYPYLCFMHDDILYLPRLGVKKLIDHFQQEETGIIGVLGSAAFFYQEDYLILDIYQCI